MPGKVWHRFFDEMLPGKELHRSFDEMVCEKELYRFFDEMVFEKIFHRFLGSFWDKKRKLGNILYQCRDCKSNEAGD